MPFVSGHAGPVLEGEIHFRSIRKEHLAGVGRFLYITTPAIWLTAPHTRATELMTLKVTLRSRPGGEVLFGHIYEGSHGQDLWIYSEAPYREAWGRHIAPRIVADLVKDLRELPVAQHRKPS